MKEFLNAWAPLFRKHDVKLTVVWDLDEMPYAALDGYGLTWHAMAREHVAPFIPVGTDMIRSWGFYQAWLDGSEYILTLDDDVRPGYNDPFEAYEQAFRRGAPLSRFLDVGALTSSGAQMRGFPYRDRKRVKVQVQYGGWSGVLDYDAATQLSTQPGENHTFSHVGVLPVPKGAPVTTCIMNCAFRREFTPAMWQLPMWHGKYNRFGDIWSGLFQKRVLDIIGEAMVLNNSAIVRHERASNAIVNLEREQPGVALNEQLADVVFDPALVVGTDTLANIYRYVTDWASAIFPGEYRTHFQWARDQWLELFA